MNIAFMLSTESIEAAVNELQMVKDILETKTSELVEILANEGEDIANAAYGDMVTAESRATGFYSSEISVGGGDKAIIAEFGAGYATMEYHPFAGNAPVPIKVASYSEAHFEDYHGGLFWITDQIHPGEGYWIFGWSFGKKGHMGSPNYYDRVQPRHGLLDAYDYIMQHGTDIALEVIRFD